MCGPGNEEGAEEVFEMARSCEVGNFTAGCNRPEVCGMCGQGHRMAKCCENSYTSTAVSIARPRDMPHGLCFPKFEEVCRRLEGQDPRELLQVLPM